jgi:hypothetical protein
MMAMCMMLQGKQEALNRLYIEVCCSYVQCMLHTATPCLPLSIPDMARAQAFTDWKQYLSSNLELDWTDINYFVREVGKLQCLGCAMQHN